MLLSGDKNVDMKILNNLEDNDLVNVCRVNKKADEICMDQMFWLNRILTKFPGLTLDILNRYKGNRNWSQYYINDLRIANQNPSANALLIQGADNGRFDHIIIALGNGAYVNAFAGQPLVSAVTRGDLPIVKYLVEEHGANIHVRSDTITGYAWRHGHQDIIDYLVSKGAPIIHPADFDG